VKLVIFVDWMNTWGAFYFFKSPFLGPWDLFFPISLCMS